MNTKNIELFLIVMTYPYNTNLSKNNLFVKELFVIGDLARNVNEEY